MPVEQLEEENKTLRTKVRVLEEELKHRNAECVRLRDELQLLSGVMRENDSQRQLIDTLREELEFSRKSHAEAVEALNVEEKQRRNEEHRQRMARVQLQLSTSGMDVKTGTSPQAGGAVLPVVTGGVVPTSSGVEIICKSSNISSLGFAPVQRPPDFAGSAYGQFCKGVANSADLVEEEDEVSRLMAMAKDGAMLDIKHAEVTDGEENELLERYKALKLWKPN
ncbi:hypothetical protein DPX39_100123900 [Trypanosoma brucei equiperdum]|uniref:Uncharacterized protein n=1 Tax=Trypanosoma brucei equiperdum TaxID=630700 RepID=A0A3L6KXB0_9TRYP|nr:hypothetical protein DPX39_100123900 [Trypanosoma brucei equiperdum]